MALKTICPPSALVGSSSLSEAGSYHKLLKDETEGSNLAHQTATPESTCNQQRDVSSTTMTRCLNAITQSSAEHVHSAAGVDGSQLQAISKHPRCAGKQATRRECGRLILALNTITAFGREAEQKESTLIEPPDFDSWTTAVRDGRKPSFLLSHVS